MERFPLRAAVAEVLQAHEVSFSLSRFSIPQFAVRFSLFAREGVPIQAAAHSHRQSPTLSVTTSKQRWDNITPASAARRSLVCWKRFVMLSAHPDFPFLVILIASGCLGPNSGLLLRFHSTRILSFQRRLGVLSSGLRSERGLRFARRGPR